MSNKGIGSSDTSDLLQFVNDIEQAGKGKLDGLSLCFLTKDIIDNYKEKKTKAKTEMEQKPTEVAAQTAFAYAAQAHRDAIYATRGRKYMRCLGLTSQALASMGRAAVINLKDKISK